MSVIFSYDKAPLSGPAVIEASAGTGKTHSIAQIYLRLIIERKLAPESILVVTFTEAATGELKERIRNSLSMLERECAGEQTKLSKDDPYIQKLLIDSKRLPTVRALASAALASFDEASIFTIHGFCRRVLRDHAFEYSAIFNSELVEDVEPIALEITRDFYRRNFYGASKFVVYCAAKSGVDIESLYNLLKNLLPKNGISIIPDGGNFGEIKKIENEVTSAFKNAKKAWLEHGADFRDKIIADDAPVNRRLLSVTKAENLHDEFENHFAFDFPQIIDVNFEKDKKPLAFCFTADFITGLETKAKGSVDSIQHHPLVHAMQKYIAVQRVCAYGIDMAFSSLKANYISYTLSELGRRKGDRNIWSFNDLLSEVRNGLVGPRGKMIASSIRRRYPAVLVDEFQDTDPVQCDIFEKLFNHGDSLLFYIGDPKQAIYTFRGADVEAYISAKKGKPEFIKNENWRSHENLINSVNRIFSLPDPFMLGSEVSYNAVSPRAEKGHLDIKDGLMPMVVWTLRGDEKDKPLSKGAAVSSVQNSAASEIVKLLTLSEKGEANIVDKEQNKKALKPADCAVIVRTNFEALSMKEKLRALGVPAVIARTGSVYESRVKRWLDILLAAVYSRREPLIRAALSTGLFCYSMKDLSEISEDQSKWEKVLESFRLYYTEWENRGFMAMFSIVMKEQNIYDNIASSDDGVRNLSDLMHLSELYHRASVERSFGPSELISWSAKKTDELSVSTEEHRTRLETDDDAVKIITVHASKGLEYPVVFVACGFDSHEIEVSPQLVYHNDGKLVCDLTVRDDNDPRALKAAAEEQAENIRLLYVAITRASHRCYIAAGKISGYQRSAAGYLFHSASCSRAGDDEVSRIHRYVTVAEVIKGLSSDHIIEDIKKVSGGVFSVIDIPAPGEMSMISADKKSGAKLSVRSAVRKIRDDWKISSFSYIVSSRSDSADDGHDVDESAEADDEIQPAFPKGANAGSCVHEIFESLNFSKGIDDSAMASIEKILSKYDFDVSYSIWIKGMCERVLSKEVPVTGSSLSALSSDRYLAETEFYFPAKDITAAGFTDLMISNLEKSFNGGRIKGLASISFDRFAGFLKGYIDLIFECGGKYYIIDWKTNHLGENFADYSEESMNTEMDRHLYTVQAAIYSLALHLHLSQRLPDYKFENNFGGVIYLFVRGVNPDGNEGVWEWRPQKKLVESLESYMVRRSQ